MSKGIFKKIAILGLLFSFFAIAPGSKAYAQLQEDPNIQQRAGFFESFFNMITGGSSVWNAPDGTIITTANAFRNYFRRLPVSRSYRFAYQGALDSGDTRRHARTFAILFVGAVFLFG